MLDYIKLACYNGFKLDKQAKNDKQKVSSSKVVFAVAIHHSRLAGAFCGTPWQHWCWILTI